MQSGKGNTQDWILVFEEESPRTPDPLMGWTSASETATQVRLRFPTRQDAEAYARRRGIAYVVQPESPVRTQKKSYSDNFKFGRSDNWTH
jgi:hypothetical protein